MKFIKIIITATILYFFYAGSDITSSDCVKKCNTTNRSYHWWIVTKTNISTVWS